MYSPQNPYAQPPQGSYPYPPQQPSGANSYPPQGAYSPQYPSQPPVGGYPYASQNPYAQPPQGAYPYTPQGPYIPQQPYMWQNAIPLYDMNNRRAVRAMISGIISLALSLLTLATLVGFAGIITGISAIIYGFIALKRAQQLPNQKGRSQAIAGIVMGFIACFIVLLSLALRAINGGTTG